MGLWVQGELQEEPILLSPEMPGSPGERSWWVTRQRALKGCLQSLGTAVFARFRGSRPRGVSPDRSPVVAEYSEDGHTLRMAGVGL